MTLVEPAVEQYAVDHTSPLAEHGVIVADNMFHGGSVLDDPPSEEGRMLRDFAADVLADPRVDSALLTVADGLLLIWRR